MNDALDITTPTASSETTFTKRKIENKYRERKGEKERKREMEREQERNKEKQHRHNRNQKKEQDRKRIHKKNHFKQTINHKSDCLCYIHNWRKDIPDNEETELKIDIPERFQITVERLNIVLKKGKEKYRRLVIERE